MKIARSFVLLSLMVAGLWSAGGIVESVEAAMVTQLDFTSGAVNWAGQNGSMLDRLFGQEGTITMGSYQSMSEIVDPITRGHNTFSLFTSGLSGAPVPSATITGNSITVDLTSLFFGWQRGDEIRTWNIGGQATGLVNPGTSEFSLSWEHIFNAGKGHHHGMGDRIATFFLQGTVVGSPAAVPIPAAVFLYGTGMFGVGSWAWLKRRGQGIKSA